MPSPRWAHPRSRGENIKPGLSENAHLGSSPLTRGKPADERGPLPIAGLIPAHAGKTTTVTSRSSKPAAHPRSRGENANALVCSPVQGGSSPLTRGKHRVVVVSRNIEGLIPAHTGKTGRLGQAHADGGAHPRSRGENPFLMPASAASSGSSPLTRGKRQQAGRTVDVLGLIPAHAGKTADGAGSRRCAVAHPRSRGENASVAKGLQTLSGSSPLTRGKLFTGYGGLDMGGLIPAHAGKTVVGGVAAAFWGAHPRSRGENSPVTSSLGTVMGSSPLTRGKQGRRGQGPDPLGLIPAHAGKTYSPLSTQLRARAHPRSRGENRFTVRQSFQYTGSSPLTRGKPRRRAWKTDWVKAHPRSRGENLVVSLEECTPVGSSPLTRGKPGPAVDGNLDLGLIPAHAGKTRRP